MRETVTLSEFKGLNNVLKPENTPEDYLKTAENIDIDKSGNLHKRKGYQLLDAGKYQSIWSNGKVCYVVKENTLYSFDGTLTPLAPVSGALSFTEADGLIYFASQRETGIIENGIVRTWGIAPPNPPTISETTGILKAGTYQVTYTYSDINGLESGSSVASVITVGDNAGIQVDTVPSIDPRVTDINVYCSTQDGMELFYIGSNINIVSSINTASNVLKLFNLYNAPLGSEITYFKGRIYTVDNSIVWYSEAQQYEHYNFETNYLDFDSPVQGLMPVEDGLWIATTNELFFAGGFNPFNLSLKENVKMVIGTAAKIPADYIGGMGYSWIITTDEGLFMLANSGQYKNMTAGNLALESADNGTGIFVQHDGMNQYMSLIRKTDKPNNAVFGDIISGEIIRNGVSLPS